MTATAYRAAAPARPAAPGLLSGLVNRKLPHYPTAVPRYTQLGLAVIATITLYYELYVQGAVSTSIARDLGMSFAYLVGVGVVGNACGALASFAAGLADKWGRANIVAFGLFLTGALTLVGLPHASSKATYLVMYSLLSVVEGAVLVATPALIRDFSPQVGRASAMGFWTMGPVLGSLIVTQVASRTLDTHPNWRFQFYVSGTAGLVVAVICFVGLRELAPAIRDQIMVSLKDAALVEARAKGIDEAALLANPWRQMLNPRIVLSALGISVFLLAYYVFVGFFVVYAATVLGYSEAKANALANWYWGFNAIGLVVAGIVSDRLRVRKPFMLLGGVLSAAGLATLATLTTHMDVTYYDLAGLFAFSAFFGGLCYVAWMAAYTENVEQINPAATATGLAVWGMIIRSTVVVGFLVLPAVVPASNPLVDDGPKAQALSARYAEQLDILQSVSPATQAALKKDPNDQLAQAQAVVDISNGQLTVADVVRAATLQAQHPQELATVGAIKPEHAALLLKAQPSQDDYRVVVGDIAQKFGIDMSAATVRLLQYSAQVPQADQDFLKAKGGTVTLYADRLKAANAAIPPADLAFLTTQGPKVLQAQKDAPGQWQDWYWICFGGQIAFLLTIALLRGRWNPLAAKRDEEQHEAAVAAELARMAAANPVPEQRAAAGQTGAPVTA